MNGIYSLDDFGQRQSADTLNPVNMLMVLIGFSILIFNKSIESWPDSFVSYSAFFGAIYLIGYMLYLTDYHEKIWSRYYSLPIDIMFFRAYGLMIAIVIITLMHTFPQYWYFYISTLMFFMWVKKRKTTKMYHFAFDARFKNFSECEDMKYKALYALAHNFTINFFWAGFILSCAESAVLFFLYHFRVTAGPYDVFGVSITVNMYALVSAIVVLFTVLFWIKKMRVGLNEFADRIERGDWKYFVNENSM